MKVRLFFSLLFPFLLLCASCSVSTRVAGVDRDKQLYMDSVFFPYPDASIVGGVSGDKLLEQLNRYHLQDAVEPKAGANVSFFEKDSVGNLVASVYSDILFDFDKSEIRPGQSEIIDAIVKELLSLASAPVVALVGHTDNVGSEEYNLRLSQRRAQSVADYITSIYAGKIGVQSVLGLGESKPAESNDSPEGRQKNRRVEIIVSHGGK
ncbi:OmpA family protein [uncultured Porphyromonas sp.]|uniref:OmpA family protein n=1 Tax=uncultured Porphyromonas sp. TaxID=159274 RepID=UPI002592ECAE|nr:OmpA family protein [uncultured Porphyromonas sp.]